MFFRTGVPQNGRSSKSLFFEIAIEKRKDAVVTKMPIDLKQATGHAFFCETIFFKKSNAGFIFGQTTSLQTVKP
jgi:hypothetical protein